ncbi:hypothetical protein H9P43_004780 [Blastocladiella emersonii ATCC 22665]|nr:hypothetical protein H9P43_004780 [Blastocladiella emersonii ATCC 22665]
MTSHTEILTRVLAGHNNVGDPLDADTLADLAEYLASDILPLPSASPPDADALAAMLAAPLAEFAHPAGFAPLFLALLADDVHELLRDPESAALRWPSSTNGDGVDDEGDELLEPGHCELCERGPMRLSFHHLIPKKTHRRLLKKGVFARAEMETRGALLCRGCHSAVHRIYDHETLALKFNTVDKLLESDEVCKWVEFQRKQKVRQRMLK